MKYQDNKPQFQSKYLCKKKIHCITHKIKNKASILSYKNNK